jgi:hypothetical protein
LTNCLEAYLLSEMLSFRRLLATVGLRVCGALADSGTALKVYILREG